MLDSSASPPTVSTCVRVMGGFGRIAKVALSADGAPGATTKIALPFEGSIDLMATDPRVPGAVFGLTGVDASLLYYAVNADGR